jgi:hypothetical protein
MKAETSVNSYQIFMLLNFQKEAFVIVTSEVRQSSHALFWFNTFLVKACCKNGNENTSYIRRGILLVEYLIKNFASKSLLKIRSDIAIILRRIHVSVGVYLHGSAVFGAADRCSNSVRSSDQMPDVKVCSLLLEKLRFSAKTSFQQ